MTLGLIMIEAMPAHPTASGRRLADLGLCGLCVVLAVVSLVFGARNYDSVTVLLATDGHSVVLAASFPVVGALIATHRPQNLVGWTFCAIGLSFALVTFAYEYGVYTLQTAPGTLPGGRWRSGSTIGPGRLVPGSCLPLLLCCSPMGGCRHDGGGRWRGYRSS
jgi:hypothetical protein